MRKRNIRIGCIALCAVLATGCSGRNRDDNEQNNVVAEATPTTEAMPTAETTPTTETTPTAEDGNTGDETEIGIDKAKSIALNDAGLKEENVHFIKEKQEMDDGRMVYEIEFYDDNKEYDYEIEASTGNIISKDYDIENHELTSDNSAETGTKITIEKAKKIALKKAGLTEKDGTWKKEKTDRDDGRIMYELEFISGEMEYDFEIDAESGSILEFEKESVYD